MLQGVSTEGTAQHSFVMSTGTARCRPGLRIIELMEPKAPGGNCQPCPSSSPPPPRAGLQGSPHCCSCLSCACAACTCWCSHQGGWEHPSHPCPPAGLVTSRTGVLPSPRPRGQGLPQSKAAGQSQEVSVLLWFMTPVAPGGRAHSCRPHFTAQAFPRAAQHRAADAPLYGPSP